jgi:hypothetical protein
MTNERYTVVHNEWVSYNRSEDWDIINVVFGGSIPIPVLLQWIKFIVDFQNLYKDNIGAMKKVSVDLSKLGETHIKELVKFLCKYTTKNRIAIYCEDLKKLKGVTNNVFESP